MNKTEKWQAALEVLTNNNIATDVVAALAELFEPKAGGAKVDIEEVVVRDEAGNIIEMICSLSGVTLPATADFFYADKTGDGVGGTGLKRLSMQAEKARKEHSKMVKATKEAIKEDLYAGVIDVAEAKELEANIPGVDYSHVSAELVEEAETEEA